MEYEVLEGMADLNSGSDLFPEVMKYISMRSLFKSFSSILTVNNEFGNVDDQMWSPIVNESYDHKDAKENRTGRGRYTSLSMILFQEF